MKIENKNIELLSSVARTATTNSGDITNKDLSGIHLVIDVTSVTDTPSVVPTLQAKDPISNKYYTLLVGTAITSVGTTVLKVFPGSPVSANVSANDILPLKFRVLMTHADSDSITYSVSANLV